MKEQSKMQSNETEKNPKAIIVTTFIYLVLDPYDKRCKPAIGSILYLYKENVPCVYDQRKKGLKNTFSIFKDGNEHKFALNDGYKKFLTYVKKVCSSQ